MAKPVSQRYRCHLPGRPGGSAFHRDDEVVGLDPGAAVLDGVEAPDKIAELFEDASQRFSGSRAPRAITNGPKYSAYCLTASSTDGKSKLMVSRAIAALTPAALNTSATCASIIPPERRRFNPGGGGGIKEPVSLNSSPTKPSLTNIVIAIRPLGRETRVSSAAARPWSGANIAPNVDVTRCQRPSVSPHPRPSFLPAGGHGFSPLVAIESPHHRGCSCVIRSGA
jgi:hypothetical protein